MYGSQPPSQSYYHPSQPPSYPEWRQSRPTEHGQSWQGPPAPVSSPPPTQPPPATSQPTTSFYNPNMYGPMPGSVASPTLDHVSQPQSVVNIPSPKVDTSSWGVRYNQQHGHQHQSSSMQSSQPLIPPPVPPRPASGLDQPQLQTASGQQMTWNPAQAQQPYYPPNTPAFIPEQQQQQQPHAPQFWQPSSYSDTSSGINQSIPPTPPPIPPAYHVEVQQQSQQGWPSAPFYSTHPPTHRYEPSQQQQQPPPPPSQTPLPPSQSQPSMVQMGPAEFNDPKFSSFPHPQNIPLDRPPSLPSNGSSLPPSIPPTTAVGVTHSPVYVSSPTPAPALPVVTQPVTSTSGASALGSGGPSDWEYFASGKQEIDDTEVFNFKPEKPPQKIDTFELASNIPPDSVQAEISKPGSQPARLSTPVGHQRPQPERVSPVSSVNAKTQQFGPSQPPQADRMDSVSSFSSMVSAEEAMSPIDSVIKQWAEPAERITPAESEPAKKQNRIVEVAENKSSRAATPVSQLQPSLFQASPKMSPPIISKVDQPVVQSITTIADPYADLDPWYKSSLTRYVTMLRKEMATESENEKFKIFTAFMTKESKLREILYNIDIVPETLKTKPADVHPPKPVDLPQEPGKAELKKLDTDLPIPTEYEDDVVTYSPGGRPVFGSSLGRGHAERKDTVSHQRSASNPSPPAELRNRADSLNFAGYVGSPVTALNPLSNLPRATSVPPGAPSSMIIPRGSAVYTPFRYQDGRQRNLEPLSFDRPAYQAYSALRQASAESGRVMAQPSLQARRGSDTLSIPKPVRAEHDETFLGLVREKSVAYRGKRPGTSVAKRAPTADPFKKGIATAIVEDIRTLIPIVLPNPAADSQIATVRSELQNFPDDFSFMEKSLEAWDRGANARQAQVDSQRRARQEDSERHIDTLFNDKEIGYSDITVLETEFKQTEAQKQLSEERKEFDKFVEIVFTRVDERLSAEITTLERHYKQALVLLNSGSDQGSKSKPEKFHLSYVMQNAADIFEKIEKRHEKRVEAVLERERRKKRAERRFFVFLGDSPALRQMDKEFDAAEKRILLDTAKARDDRANQLMDSFDEASMRGIGENQSLLDDISSKIEKLDPSLVSDVNSLPPHAHKTLLSALDFVRFLGSDSESILSSFGMADRLLNNADYEVSVAEAKVANAGPDIFRRLEEEKKKEDRKIEADLELRMSDVRNGCQEIMKSIQDVLDQMQKAESSLGSDNSNGGDNLSGPTIGLDGTPLMETIPGTTPIPASSPFARPGPADEQEQQQERLRKALEEAKRRNAAKQES
ncbi:hypothetical protein PRK78_005556 [Emydomyces testavorans]|uniref:Uncharacterized protein n=1 Tax=Emydomyces testavorans TaxID=2070801 RepID=A0AAF0IKR5_9EURO|nr:hypothetical protein PRK78_005556 [Emydomyces testavorans]